MIKQKRITNKHRKEEPVLDFISSRVNTLGARRLTKGIKNLYSLWLLAKMSNNIKKCNDE
ncbi:MAG: hypothetical protein E7089_06720 [Bacteroidales bacterium]|nr:hypothetical protein [Bacteroidales bacterium]